MMAESDGSVIDFPASSAAASSESKTVRLENDNALVFTSFFVFVWVESADTYGFDRVVVVYYRQQFLRVAVHSLKRQVACRNIYHIDRMGCIGGCGLRLYVGAG